MDHETAGDPLSGLKWTRRTTAKVAAELCKLGTDVCARRDQEPSPVSLERLLGLG